MRGWMGRGIPDCLNDVRRNERRQWEFVLHLLARRLCWAHRDESSIMSTIAVSCESCALRFVLTPSSTRDSSSGGSAFGRARSLFFMPRSGSGHQETRRPRKPLGRITALTGPCGGRRKRSSFNFNPHNHILFPLPLLARPYLY